jgi:hypothetical protein
MVVDSPPRERNPRMSQIAHYWKNPENERMHLAPEGATRTYCGLAFGAASLLAGDETITGFRATCRRCRDMHEKAQHEAVQAIGRCHAE